MATICPTITESDISAYNERIKSIAKFAKRVHIDVMDGVFTPTKSPNLIQLHWLDDMAADVHVMYEDPSAHLETLISLQPSLVIFHAEAKGDLTKLAKDLKGVGIKAGVALLPETSVESAQELIKLVDHVLIFGGKLGYHGGRADLDQLEKTAKVKKINQNAEISWDGGINDENAKKLVEAGIDVLNVGGYIAHADDAQAAYGKLLEAIGGAE